MKRFSTSWGQTPAWRKFILLALFVLFTRIQPLTLTWAPWNNDMWGDDEVGDGVERNRNRNRFILQHTAVSVEQGCSHVLQNGKHGTLGTLGTQDSKKFNKKETCYHWPSWVKTWMISNEYFPAVPSCQTVRRNQQPQPATRSRQFAKQETIQIVTKKTSLSSQNLSFLASWRLIVFCSIFFALFHGLYSPLDQPHREASAMQCWYILTNVAIFGYWFSDSGSFL